MPVRRPALLAAGCAVSAMLAGMAGPAVAVTGPECADTATVSSAPDVDRALPSGARLQVRRSPLAELTVVSGQLGEVSLRVLSSSPGTARATARLAQVPGLVAAMNADFFSYTRSGLFPRSSVLDSGRPVLAWPTSTPVLAVDSDGRLHATTLTGSGALTLTWSRSGTVHRLLVPLASVNTPSPVVPGAAALHSAAYAASLLPASSGEVRIRGGRVVSRTWAASARRRPPVPGTMAVSLSAAQAARIRSVPVGARASWSWTARTGDGSRPRSAVGRGAVLLSHGAVAVRCTSVQRPRAAVGWDEQGRVWLMVAQGGTGSEPGPSGIRTGGTTVHQMAVWLAELGAVSAVALDGGGSATVVVASPQGPARVDLPASAWQRPVPNALALVSP